MVALLVLLVALSSGAIAESMSDPGTLDLDFRPRIVRERLVEANRPALIFFDGSEAPGAVVFNENSRWPVPDVPIGATDGQVRIQVQFSCTQPIAMHAIQVRLDGADITGTCRIEFKNNDEQFLICDTDHAYTPGDHVAEVRVHDQSIQWTYPVFVAPVVTLVPEFNASFPPGAKPTIVATFSDRLRAIDVRSILFEINGLVPATSPAIVMSSDREGELRYVPPEPLPGGYYTVRIRVANDAGATSAGHGSFRIRVADENHLEWPVPDAGLTIQEPDLELVIRAWSNHGQDPDLWVNEVAVTESSDRNDRFIVPITLVPGENLLRIRVLFADGESREMTRTVTYEVPRAAWIGTPLDGQSIVSLPTGSANTSNPSGDVQRPVQIARVASSGHIDVVGVLGDP